MIDKESGIKRYPQADYGLITLTIIIVAALSYLCMLTVTHNPLRRTEIIIATEYNPKDIYIHDIEGSPRIYLKQSKDLIPIPTILGFKARPTLNDELRTH